MSGDRTTDTLSLISTAPVTDVDPLTLCRKHNVEVCGDDIWNMDAHGILCGVHSAQLRDSLERRLALDRAELGAESAPANPEDASEMYDYSLPPGRPDDDLIEIARERIGVLAPRQYAFQAVNPEYWSGYDEHKCRLHLRGGMIGWRSRADADRLFTYRWTRPSIAVWCYPYAYDVNLSYTHDPQKAAAKCVELLQAEGWQPPMDPTVRATVEGDADSPTASVPECMPPSSGLPSDQAPSNTSPASPVPPLAAAEYEELTRGRFGSCDRFLHEVGYVASKLDAVRLFPSSAVVSKAMGDRYGDVESVSDRVLKQVAARWFGSWPRARRAARAHYTTCTPGPSCVPPEVRK